MKVETFLICDAVGDLPDGRHAIQGERREFIVPAVPAISHPICMPIYIRLVPSERGRHKVRFTVKSQGGENATDGYELDAGFPGKYISFVYQDVLRFPSPGNYTARLTVDGRTVATWPFVVKVLATA